MIIGCVCKHPKHEVTDLTNNFITPLLDKLSNENKDIMIMDDFNVSLINYNDDKNTANFLDTMFSQSFLSHVTTPTRVKRNRKTLIDNIYYNKPLNNIISRNLSSIISDYLIQFLIEEAELFARCSLLFACCSLLFAPWLLVFARCSLLFAPCLLVFALCSLRFARCSLLFARCSLLFARCSLLFARFSLHFARCLFHFARCWLFFRPNYCERKLLRTAKKWFDYNETPPQIFSLQISEILVTFFGWWFPKFSQHAKPFSKLT